MNLKPTRDRIIVKPVDVDNVTESGLIIPGSRGEKPTRGEIMATGPGKYEYGVWIEVELVKGDEVMFEAHTGTPLNVDGEEYIMMRDNEVIAIVE